MTRVDRRQFIRRMLAVSTAGAALTVTGCGSRSRPATSTGGATDALPQTPTRAAATVSPTAVPTLAAPTAVPTVVATVAAPTDIPTQLASTPTQARPTATPAPAMPVTPAEPTATGSKVLLAYFSRAGENYYYGERTNLKVGNTEVLAGMITRLIKCDVHRIEPVKPYPEDYEETVAQNAREQNADARPAIANPLASIENYDTVLLGSPIWGGRAPMIMSTFVEGLEWTGKTVVPFTTHAGSGLGTVLRDYAASCPGAKIGEGLAVRGEEVQQAGAAVESWLRRINLLA